MLENSWFPMVMAAKLMMAVMAEMFILYFISAAFVFSFRKHRSYQGKIITAQNIFKKGFYLVLLQWLVLSIVFSIKFTQFYDAVPAALAIIYVVVAIGLALCIFYTLFNLPSETNLKAFVLRPSHFHNQNLSPRGLWLKNTLHISLIVLQP